MKKNTNFGPNWTLSGPYEAPYGGQDYQKLSKWSERSSYYSILSVFLVLLSISGLQYVKYYEKYLFWPKLNPFQVLQTPVWRSVLSKPIKTVRNSFVVFHSVSYSGFNVNQRLTIRQIWWQYRFWTKLTPIWALRTPAWRAVLSKTI